MIRAEILNILGLGAMRMDSFYDEEIDDIRVFTQIGWPIGRVSKQDRVTVEMQIYFL